MSFMSFWSFSVSLWSFWIADSSEDSRDPSLVTSPIKVFMECLYWLVIAVSENVAFSGLMGVNSRMGRPWCQLMVTTAKNAKAMYGSTVNSKCCNRWLVVMWRCDVPSISQPELRRLIGRLSSKVGVAMLPLFRVRPSMLNVRWSQVSPNSCLLCPCSVCSALLPSSSTSCSSSSSSNSSCASASSLSTSCSSELLCSAFSSATGRRPILDLLAVCRLRRLLRLLRLSSAPPPGGWMFLLLAELAKSSRALPTASSSVDATCCCVATLLLLIDTPPSPIVPYPWLRPLRTSRR